ncbi:MAG: riboflavin kinase [Patescibacteria group bacterium]
MKYVSEIIAGRGQGHLIGYPTFNLIVPDNFQYQYGVYAAKVKIGGKVYAGALFYGPIPTFGIEKPSLEIFVIDYFLDQTVHQLEFELLKYLRPAKKFMDQDKLTSQIKIDVEESKKVFPNPKLCSPEL